MLSTILHYCTNDYRFLDATLKQLSKFSDEIIIPMCDKFFNGELENQELLQKSKDIISKYDKCTLYMFEWHGEHRNPFYYSNLSRKLGTDIAKNEWILYVDTDELFTDEFQDWFMDNKDTDNTYWLTCNWYYREPIYQATKREAAGLLIKKKYCNWDIQNAVDRKSLFTRTNMINGDHVPVLSKTNEPMVDHFSWVRSKEELLSKVKNWGHKHDKDWVSLIEKEYSKEFDGTDIVHGYSYKTVENKYNL